MFTTQPLLRIGPAVFPRHLLVGKFLAMLLLGTLVGSLIGASLAADAVRGAELTRDAVILLTLFDLTFLCGATCVRAEAGKRGDAFRVERQPAADAKVDALADFELGGAETRRLRAQRIGAGSVRFVCC